MQFAYNRRALGLSYAILALGLIFAGWFHWIYLNPERVFKGMLKQNLQTTSVTKHIKQTTDSQAITQLIRLQSGSTNASDWLTTIVQSEDSATTETISTPTETFVRYTALKRQGKPLKNTNGVLGTWAKPNQTQQESGANLYSQTMLDSYIAPGLPIANLASTQARQLLDYQQSQKIFTPDYTHVKRQVINGKKVYIYTVSVKLEPYVKLMQLFAADLNLAALSSVSASQYHNSKPVTVSLAVDPISRQPVRLSFPIAHFSEDYQDWGLEQGITLPKKTITLDQLQAKVQAL